MAAYTPPRKLGPDGEIELSEKQELFLEWLCGDRPAGETMEQFAKRIGVSTATLRRWKRNDKPFLRRWEERMRETHAHPDKLSAQLDSLYDLSIRAPKEADRIKATELYWRLVDRMSPDRVEVQSSKSIAQLSDEELDALIEAELRSEKERRVQAAG